MTMNNSSTRDRNIRDRIRVILDNIRKEIVSSNEEYFVSKYLLLDIIEREEEHQLQSLLEQLNDVSNLEDMPESDRVFNNEFIVNTEELFASYCKPAYCLALIISKATDGMPSNDKGFYLSAAKKLTDLISEDGKSPTEDDVPKFLTLGEYSSIRSMISYCYHVVNLLESREQSSGRKR
jgi:hypothetical protein